MTLSCKYWDSCLIDLLIVNITSIFKKSNVTFSMSRQLYNGPPPWQCLLEHYVIIISAKSEKVNSHAKFSYVCMPIKKLQ